MRSTIIFYFLFAFNNLQGHTQTIDSSISDVSKQVKNKIFYKTKVFKATIVPAMLIGYGISTIHNNGLPSSAWVYKEVHEHLNISKSNIDDYLQYAPYVGLFGLDLLKIKKENDLINTGILTMKSVVLNMGIVFTLKGLTNITRPDSANPRERNSFPSGHTANAFAAATLVHKEFGKTSLWYSAGAYTIASTVGVFRILNNRHWFADVISGAGIGILSVNLVYLTHLHRWGRIPGIVVMPYSHQKALGIYVCKKF